MDELCYCYPIPACILVHVIPFQFYCMGIYNTVHLTVNKTILGDSPVPLHTWFENICIFTNIW